jgi:hypothetical protein
MKSIPKLAVSVVCTTFLLPAVAFFTVRCGTTKSTRSAAPAVTAQALPSVTPPVVQPEPEPTVTVVPRKQRPNRDREKTILAAELQRLWTRDASMLVDVVDNAFESSGDVPPLTLLLAIAHAETNGLVLDVSEAGAVGLAQATPTAYLSEGFNGKLFVTRDYINGTKAYLLKKPLRDADVIAGVYLDHGDGARDLVNRMLKSAFELRLEGIAELDTLTPYASSGYLDSVERANDRNLALLEELSVLIERGDREGLKKLRVRVDLDYRAMMAKQRESWRRYQLDLADRRDQMLFEKFGESPAVVKKTRAYEAGEYLARELDARFSPSQMACFLAQHLRTKQEEARKLGAPENDLHTWTAALYNGGSHNVKRMQAGLIGSLKETQDYMRKVPATMRKLDSSLAGLEIGEVARGAS